MVILQPGPKNEMGYSIPTKTLKSGKAAKMWKWIRGIK